MKSRKTLLLAVCLSSAALSLAEREPAAWAQSRRRGSSAQPPPPPTPPRADSSRCQAGLEATLDGLVNSVTGCVPPTTRYDRAEIALSLTLTDDAEFLSVTPRVTVDGAANEPIARCVERVVRGTRFPPCPGVPLLQLSRTWRLEGGH